MKEYRVTYLDRSGHRAHASLTAENGESALHRAKELFDDVLKVRLVGDMRLDGSRSRVSKSSVFMFCLGVVLLLVLLAHAISVFCGRWVQ